MDFTRAQQQTALEFVDIAEDRLWSNERKKESASSRLQSTTKMSREDANLLVEEAVRARKRVPHVPAHA